MVNLCIEMFIFLGCDPLSAAAWANKVFGFFVTSIILVSMYALKVAVDVATDKLDKTYDTAKVKDDPQANALVSASTRVASAIFWGLAIIAVLH